MPRTKRPVAKKKPERLPDNEEAARRKLLDEIVEEHKHSLDQRCENEIKNLQLAFKILQSSLSKDTLYKTIGQLKSELAFKEKPKHPTTAAARNASQDDGYLTEGSAHDSGGAVRPRRVSRSATRMDEHLSYTENRTGKRRSRSENTRITTAARRTTTARGTRPPVSFKPPVLYRTPAAYKTPHHSAQASFPPITPKVVPNMPLTVLRRPRQGETVVSMSGSPLMVSTMQAEDKANCNIPLVDGTMLSLQPENMRKSSTFIPFSLLNTGVLRQLETIKDNIDTMLQLSHKNKS